MNHHNLQHEANLLWYKPSKIIQSDDGAIRTALRAHDVLKHALISDLYMAEGVDAKKTAAELITAAEEKLLATGVTKIDAVILDGNKTSDFFIAAGYWPSRKTVVVEWDLSKIDKPTLPEELEVKIETEFDPTELADFVVHSYQPYWTWWKDDAFDRMWDRIDYPSMEPDEIEQKNTADNREKVITMLQAARENPEQKFFIARRGGKIVAMCDAYARTGTHDDTFQWGAMLVRDHPGKGLGNFLVMSSLNWLKSKGLSTALITTTSGLDDFDPTVYLYVQSCGGKIKAEFLNLVKRKFSS